MTDALEPRLPNATARSGIPSNEAVPVFPLIQRLPGDHL